MSFTYSFSSFVPVSLEPRRTTFAGYPLLSIDPSCLVQNVGEFDTDPGHKVADIGGLSGIPERNMFTTGQWVQVRPPCQELSGGKRQSHCLFWLTQGECDKHLRRSFITVLFALFFFLVLQWRHGLSQDAVGIHLLHRYTQVYLVVRAWMQKRTERTHTGRLGYFQRRVL